MKYVLIPVTEGRANAGDGEMVMPAMIMNSSNSFCELCILRQYCLATASL